MLTTPVNRASDGTCVDTEVLPEDDVDKGHADFVQGLRRCLERDLCVLGDVTSRQRLNNVPNEK